MHFIFVACNKNKNLYRDDPSFIYRCENLAYGLKELGHTYEFFHLSSFSWTRRADVVVFHRPNYSLKLNIILFYLKLISSISIADIDDFIFDSEYANESPAVKNNILPLKKIKKQFDSNLNALKLFSYITVSTAPLVNHLNRLIPNAKVLQLENSVHHTWISIKNDTMDTKVKKLSYFPGTKSHDKDFSFIAKQLSIFLKKHPDIELQITGPLNFDLDLPPGQVIHNKKVPFSEHWKNYQNIWVNLAPLEITPFNECKSALKVIEAGFWGIPTICTKIPDTERFKNSGALLVESESEWINQLEALCDDNIYLRVQDKIKNNFEALVDVKTIALRFTNFIEKEFFNIEKKSILFRLFPSYLAKRRRKRGLYDYHTLWYYKKVWQKHKTPKSFLAYCMFRRDLGYTLSGRRINILTSYIDTFNIKEKKYAISLLNEANIDVTKNASNKINSRTWFNLVFENQLEWRKTFINELYKGKDGGVCIVGNSASINNTMLGEKIDKHKFVIRFNNCFHKENGNQDTGNKLDIWVSAPDFRGKTQASARWVIVSGPDMIYREVKWDRFESYVKSGGYIIGIPLDIWKKLVFELKAPPSAGILTLFWFREIFGHWSNISAAGFDLNLTNEVYHLVDSKHIPGKRHNWQKEKDLLKQWKSEGLKFLV